MTVRDLRKIFSDCCFSVTCDSWGEDYDIAEDEDSVLFEQYLDKKVKDCFPYVGVCDILYICCVIEE